MPLLRTRPLLVHAHHPTPGCLRLRGECLELALHLSMYTCVLVIIHCSTPHTLSRKHSEESSLTCAYCPPLSPPPHAAHIRSEERLESGLYSRTYLENQLAVALGGRIAEELIFGEDDITTGASGDFQQVTRIARLMVTQLGFAPELGQVSWSGGGGGMMASQIGQPPETSMATADKIDNEVCA